MCTRTHKDERMGVDAIPDRQVLWAYLAASIYLVLLGGSEFCAYRRETLSVSYCAAAIAVMVTAFVCCGVKRTWLPMATLVVKAGSVAAVGMATAATLLFYRPRGWDACAYLN